MEIRGRARRRAYPFVLLALGVAYASSPARAGNTIHPRTPVSWPDGECIRTVDRSTDPVFHIDYTIPFEDTNLTVDELADSRTHQFLAFCRQFDRERQIPDYVSDADLARAIAAGLTDATVDDHPDATLERASSWSGCWSRVNADDARQPITFAAAEAGVDWDTAGVGTGVHQLVGYTWEPPLNLWRPAPYVVRVVDTPGQDIGPAAVIPSVPQVVDAMDTVDIPVCIDAATGSQLHVEWALAEPGAVFERILTLPVADTLDTVSFEPPEAAWGQSILVSVVVEDPQARTYTAHAPRELIVIDSSAGGSTSSSGGDAGTETGDASDSGDPDPGSATPGCAVVSADVDGRGRAWALAAFVLTLVSFRRRRDCE